MNNIYLTGDTHGCWGTAKSNVLGLKDRLEKVENGSTVIILGDFGFIFMNHHTPKRTWLKSEQDKLKKMQKYCSERDIILMFIDGNHENFNRLYNDYPLCEKYGGQCRQIDDNIYHIERGSILTINELKFFCCGGGDSVDKAYRNFNVDWWEQEMLTKAQEDLSVDNLANNQWEVDYILTHCCTNEQILKIDDYKVLYGINSFDKFFENIEKYTKFRHWYYGHMHEDTQTDDKHTCVYGKVIKLTNKGD